MYWGALYGLKTHFNKSTDCAFVKTVATTNNQILERILFKHKKTNTYLLADAYNGKYIKQTTTHFLESASGNREEALWDTNSCLSFGGGADLLAYIGHDGLMEFTIERTFEPRNNQKRDAIMLACSSKDYFAPYLEQTGANPLLWTTGLMAPEAYTLKWAIDGWLLKETDAAIKERAAQAYHKYQKCGMRGARNLLVTGYCA